MAVKLVGEGDGTIPMCDMPDGSLGVIVNLGGEYNGRIVQMLRKSFHLKDDLVITVGKSTGNTWSHGIPDSIRVRLLKPGDTIEVVSDS